MNANRRRTLAARASRLARSEKVPPDLASMMVADALLGGPMEFLDPRDEEGPVKEWDYSD